MRSARTKKDIAVVGASAAGLYSALLLAERGHRVTVLERARSIDPARRTLIVTSSMRDYLHGLGESAVLNEIDTFELFANGHEATVPLGRPDLIIERSALIRELAKEAESAGVEIRTGCRFLGLERGRSGALLNYADDFSEAPRNLSASVVVGADGAHSSVARAAGWSQQPLVPLMQAIVTTPPDVPTNVSRVWFKPNDTRYFYWLIPESPGHCGLGVIGEDPARMRPRMERFLGDHDMTAIEYQGARIPCYKRWIPLHKRFAGAGVFLVGDAAGHVKVSTVGGIVTGFRGAAGVVDWIDSGRPGRQLLGLRAELDLHLLIRRTLHAFEVPDYSRLLELLDHETRRHLGDHTRDETTKLVWRLFLAQPRLAAVTLKHGVAGSRAFATA